MQSQEPLKVEEVDRKENQISVIRNQPTLSGSEDGGRDWSQRMWAACESWKGQETDVTLGLLENTVWLTS
jgi:hypothetical protein